MSREADWCFPTNEFDEDEGLADSGIEIYRNSPFPALARESGQNSLDAAVEAQDGTRCVSLEFTKISVPVQSIPGLKTLRATMDACLARAKARGNKNEVTFFEESKRLLSAERIDILQVADSGTAGLRGPAIPGRPFHALVKSSGVSNKPEEAGGSFGIGKNAAYTVSKLRTAFYSTFYAEGARDFFLAQGKTLLTSHVDAKGVPRKKTGYWGIDAKPVEHTEDVPAWLRRSIQGTTVSSLGFIHEPDWQHEVAESLVRNFFAAVSRGFVQFKVGDLYTINKDTIAGIFNIEEVRQAADRRGHLDDLDFSKALFRCTASEGAERLEIEIPELGKVRLHLLVEVGLPKRIGILRNDMLITDNLKHFRDKLSRFALQKDFAAALEPADGKALRTIRSLENPAHDELSPERIDDPKERRRIAGAFTRLIKWVRDEIKDRTQSSTSAEVVLDELNPFFASPERQERVTGDGEGEKHPETALIITKPERRRRAESGAGETGELGGGGGRRRNTVDDGRASGGGTGTGTLGGGSRGGQKVPIADPRNVVLSDRPGHVRRLTFTPLESGRVRLQVVASGLSNPIEVAFRRVDGLSDMFEVSAGQRINVEVDMFIPFSGPVEVALIPMERLHETQ